MDEQRVQDIERRLTQALSEHHLEETVSAITTVVKAANLDLTPTILEDLFEYMKQKILAKSFGTSPEEHVCDRLQCGTGLRSVPGGT